VNFKAFLLIMFITSLPFIMFELVNPKLDFFSGDVNLDQPSGICTFFDTPCLSWHISHPDANLSITIANGFDKPIVVTKISCSKSQNVFISCGESLPSGRQTVCDLKNHSASSVKIRAGDSNEFLLPCTDENGQAIRVGKGDAYTGKINIEYSFEGESQIGKLHGDIIQEAD
jgi:hypothetical protein